MRKLLTVLLLLWISTSAVAQQAGSYQANALSYIEQYKDLAISHMNTHGTPASVILAIAMHESGNGTSKISRLLHNHFGIKGRNTSKKLRSSYKNFESPEESYQAFIEMLSTRKQFSHLFGKYSDYDYRSWVLGINRGGYAASKLWAGQVLAMIKKYRLYEYDNRPEGYVEPPVEKTTTSPAKKHIAQVKTYKVKNGDTLSGIAKKHKTTVQAIKRKNHLKSDQLKIGQQLKI
ncbi:MAG TPA: glucosaminidase domain-containing protein [Daejeonella sp.]|nr:glucosaminidase domain-containing protein [Daejeonella sp.]